MIAKIVAIQEQLKAPKNQYNSFGKYKYRSCEDILEALKPLLSKQKLFMSMSDEIVQVEDRFYVKATVTVRDTNDIVSVSAFAREPSTKKGMDDSQITGTASSYARKYALNGMWLIDDTKDADTDEHEKQTNKVKPNKPDFNALNKDGTLNEDGKRAALKLSKLETTWAIIDKALTVDSDTRLAIEAEVDRLRGK